MQKSVKIIILLSFLVLSFPVRANAAGAVEINQLIEQENRFDHAQVTVQGEAIGEPMVRGNICWVNLNDGTNAIGVKMAASEARQIRMFGNYRQRGDTVRITGTFYKDCPEDGGETDLHANALQVVSSGQITERSVSPAKMIAAVALAFLTALCLLVLRRKKVI